MWQPNAQIIQIEFGKAIAEVTAMPGKKGLFGIGKTPDELGGQLVSITNQFQAEVREKENLIIPDFLWQFNPQLKPTEVVVRVGFETYGGEVQNFDQIFRIIVERCKHLEKSTPDRKTVRLILEDSLKQIDDNEYQEAFARQCEAYYGAARHGLELEMIRCLSDTGLIFAKNGDIERARLALNRAWELCSSPNIMDLALKCQVAYNAAQISVVGRDIETALKLFTESGVASKNLGFSHGTFMALTGLGHVATLAGNWNSALTFLEHAESILLEGDSPNYQAAHQVTKSMLALKDHLIARSNQPAKAPALFDALKKQVFSALTKSIVQAVVYRLFGVTGGLIFAIFGKQEDIRIGDGSLYIEKPSGNISF